MNTSAKVAALFDKRTADNSVLIRTLETAANDPETAGLPSGASILDLSHHTQGLLDPTPSYVVFILQFSSSAASGLAASWLYDTFKDSPARLAIDHRLVSIEPESLRQTLMATERRKGEEPRAEITPKRPPAV